MDDQQDDEIALDSEVPGLQIGLLPVALPPPTPPLISPEAGFGADEWAGRLPDGRLLAFLREPVARCHLDRLLLVDGERRTERPLPPWIYSGLFVAASPRGVLVGGARAAWRIDAAGAMTPLVEEADGEAVHVAWLPDGTAGAAGWRRIVLDGPDGRRELPCSHTVGACVVAPDLLVVSDDDGSQWIRGGRVVARDWRGYTEARGDVVVSSAGDAYRVRVSGG